MDKQFLCGGSVGHAFFQKDFQCFKVRDPGFFVMFKNIGKSCRIEKELSIDLKDSDKRLQLEILLKAIDLEKILSGK